ncbi:MAG: type II and III secretion system protein [Sutterellaceae bacterium]|nr:type II and III secretion system protein [Burkholderiaceae bacterium]MCX7900725.1 type II and III secretion system protein [Burkholderiaceae bacterium]MDW8429769.1 type II and III secretion system protein [Sutterellaceae bacterium]
MMRLLNRWLAPAVIAGAAIVLSGCAQRPPAVSTQHLQRPAAAPLPAPPPLAQARQLPPPRTAAAQETYRVSVQNVPVQELLFALARDAKMNLDLHPEVQGYVTLQAVDQTLTQILERVARQVDMRYSIEDGVLVVAPDRPFLRLYRVDYLNMQRDATSHVATATQVASTGSPGAAAGNNSRTELVNVSNNRFWTSLVESIQSLLRETDKILPAELAEAAAPAPASAPAGARQTAAAAGQPAAPQAPASRRTLYREAASVIPHPETGTIAVRATARQHARVQEFIDRLIGAARRQTLIEATVVEVDLFDEYQQGIRWDLLRSRASNFSFTVLPSGTSDALPGGTPASGQVPALGVLSFARNWGTGSVASALRLLESFGRTRVLSSPKISVLNNQTALIKVVDNFVYFTLSANYTPATANTPATLSVASTPNTVPVGFLMNVTPQIGDDNEIILNLRPTISRLMGFVDDPGVAVTLALMRQGGASVPEIRSRVPQIQTREMESIIRVRDGEIAVLGGLMRESVERGDDAVPGLADIPGVGEAFRFRNRRANKSELVIFLRPTIVRDPSLAGDFRALARSLPGPDFFDDPAQPQGAVNDKGN